MTETMKIAITNILPESKQELSYIIDKLGLALFKNDWIKFKPPQLTEIKKYNLFNSTLEIIYKSFNKKDQNELVNHFFSSALNRLVEISEISNIA